MLVMRCFKVYRMLKRGARGHDPAGVETTGPGDLVVSCGACPHRGINAPLDITTIPPEKR